ncbi:GNAT family N-acetyltransferase [Halomicrobium salinisoli]|uniref:GNAT family N-acetyltransferase n=1 Tax=Halomicrobium salinisoli TaxID=2878391 RepID=UPI001CF056ED|nr:GNAT family N-acetyltransferase [Halomicrobium salinisoli]
MRVREATSDDRTAVANVVDGAALAVDDDVLARSLDESETLVAVSDDTDRVLGALVLDGDRIAAVAVRRRRRGQGIGSALVEAAAERRERLVAEFDADVRPFYESLGFEIDAVEGERERYRGRL